jgi:hypothetical protein
MVALPVRIESKAVSPHAYPPTEYDSAGPALGGFECNAISCVSRRAAAPLRSSLGSRTVRHTAAATRAAFSRRVTLHRAKGKPLSSMFIEQCWIVGEESEAAQPMAVTA